MAVVTTKSGAITNRDASKKVLNQSFQGGNLKNSAGTVESVSGDSIGSKYLLASIPSNARVSKVLLSCDALGVGAASDVGIYKNTDDGSAVVDADFFGSAVDVSAALANSNITHESGAYDLSEVEKPLWQALGLSSDPGLVYDVVATLTGASAAAGTVSLQVDYSV